MKTEQKKANILKMLLIIAFFFMSMTLVFAYESHPLDTNYILTFSSNNATACNMTYIQSPDGTSTIYDLTLTKSGNTFYSTINGGNFSLTGETCMGLVCTDSITTETGSKCLDIKLVDEEYNTAEILRFLGLLAVGFGLAIFLYSKVSKLFGGIIIMILGVGIIASGGDLGWIGIIVLITGIILEADIALGTGKKRVIKRRRYR